MRFDIDVKAFAVTAGGLGLFTALTFGVPSALAAPVVPQPPAPPPPAPVAAPAVPVPAAPPVPAPPAQPVHVAAAPTPPSAAPPPAEAVPGEAAPPVVGTPHLSSPENLPPDTTMTPESPNQRRGVTYLRELWHAVRTQEVSGEDALLLLTQRPLDPNATPPPGMSPNPTPPQPVSPPTPAAPAPAPAPAP